MNHAEPAYGLWSLVIFNSAIFIMFAFSFFKPATARDWRSFSAFSAFIVALFVEMYGFPLTIYLLSGWLQTRFPGLDLLSHNSGHLWSTLLGEKGDPHFGILHIGSYIFLGYGFYLLLIIGIAVTGIFSAFFTLQFWILLLIIALYIAFWCAVSLWVNSYQKSSSFNASILDLS